jgi:hypothetical protein
LRFGVELATTGIEDDGVENGMLNSGLKQSNPY